MSARLYTKTWTDPKNLKVHDTSRTLYKNQKGILYCSSTHAPSVSLCSIVSDCVIHSREMATAPFATLGGAPGCRAHTLGTPAIYLWLIPSYDVLNIFSVNIGTFQHDIKIHAGTYKVFFLVMSKNSQNEFCWDTPHTSYNLLYWAKWNYYLAHNFSVCYLTSLISTFLNCFRISISRWSTIIFVTLKSDSAIFQTMITFCVNLCSTHSIVTINPFYIFYCFWLHVTKFYTQFDTDSLLYKFCHFK